MFGFLGRLHVPDGMRDGTSIQKEDKCLCFHLNKETIDDLKQKQPIRFQPLLLETEISFIRGLGFQKWRKMVDEVHDSDQVAVVVLYREEQYGTPRRLSCSKGCLWLCACRFDEDQLIWSYSAY